MHFYKFGINARDVLDKKYRRLIRIVDLLHFKLIFFEDVNVSNPILVPE